MRGHVRGSELKVKRGHAFPVYIIETKVLFTESKSPLSYIVIRKKKTLVIKL